MVSILKLSQIYIIYHIHFKNYFIYIKKNKIKHTEYQSHIFLRNQIEKNWLTFKNIKKLKCQATNKNFFYGFL